MFMLLIVFILGLCVGSFINALEYRIEENRSVSGRSFCPKCKHQLAWYDLIPVLSWIMLLGKCRYCKKQISIQYPLIELLTGLIFLSIGIKTGAALKISNWLISLPSLSPRVLIGVGGGFTLLLIISSLLLLIALYDYKTTYILSKYVYIGIALSLLYLLINYSGPINSVFFVYVMPHIWSAIIPAILFGLIYFISKGRWLGAGDIELAVLMGLLLGWPNILIAYYFAAIVGSIVGLTKIYISRKAKFNSEIAFAPFLIAGTFFAFVFGRQIVEFYVRIFLGG